MKRFKWRKVSIDVTEKIRLPASSEGSLTTEDELSIEDEAFEYYAAVETAADKEVVTINLELGPAKVIRAKRSRKALKAHRLARSKDCRRVPKCRQKKLYMHFRNMPKPVHVDTVVTRQYIPPPQPANHLAAHSQLGAHINPELERLLLELQDREITAEDYELLSQLDSTPAMPDPCALLRWLSYTAKELDLCEEERMCMICLDDINNEDNVKILLCDHVFHSCCIDEWTRSSAGTCPLDNLRIRDMRPQLLGRVSLPTEPPKIFVLPETKNTADSNSKLINGQMGDKLRVHSKCDSQISTHNEKMLILCLLTLIIVAHSFMFSRLAVNQYFIQE